jgi:hypothetical protein
VAPNDLELQMALGWGSDDLVFASRGENEPGYHSYVLGSRRDMVNSSRRVDKNLCGGIAIMTNSRLGLRTIRKLVLAIFYLQGKYMPPTLPMLGSTESVIPYDLPNGVAWEIDWKAWLGSWADNWKIEEIDGKPWLAYTGTTMRLLPAAKSTITNSRHSQDTLVVDGMDVALVLSYEDDKRVIRVVHIDGVRVIRRNDDNL